MGSIIYSIEKRIRKMRIMYITDQVYNHGGIEKVLSQKANWFAEVNGDEVYIVTSRQQNRPTVYSFSLKIKWRDLAVDYDISQSYFSRENLKKIPKHCKKLRQIISEVRPDVIISCNFAPDFYFLPFVAGKIPVIKEFHSSRAPASADRSLLGKLTAMTERRYSTIAVLNDDEKQYYQNRNIAVIPNPTELSVYKADLTSKRILAAGRISPVKNFGELINIFALVAKDFPEWQLHFYGEDYLGTEQKLKDKISELGLVSSIIFKGVSSDLKKTMQNYSIYAMTSETECFPMVLLEALSVGMPVVTYDAPSGPKHIVTDGKDGFVVPHLDQQSFVDKLTALMQDPKLREQMGKNATYNASKFSIDVVMKRWLALIDRLQKKREDR